MDRWDHASLLAAGSSPARPPAPPLTDFRQTHLVSEPSELDSPRDQAWPFRSQQNSAVLHCGWLLKSAGAGPQRQWRRRYAYLTADHLCYTPDPDADPDTCPVRFLSLDAIPVRALPRGYGPKLGVTLVEDRQANRPSPQCSPKKAGFVFSVVCGTQTHFFAAPSAADAKAWVAAITEQWMGCQGRTARAEHAPSAQQLLAQKEAEKQALRRSLAEAEQQRLRESTAQWQAAAAADTAEGVRQEGLPVACYEIEVVTGSQADAGTSARVYVELCGENVTSGDHRLMYRQPGDGGAGRTAFASAAVDRFKLHCQPLGDLVKVRVYHNNGGPSPAWFLEEVRVRRQGAACWTHFPCRRWLAVDQDDSRVLRELFSAAIQAVAPAQQPAPQQPASAAPAPQQAQQEASPPAQRVVQPVWYTVVVCTSGEEGAGLAPQEGAAVFLSLQGSRGSGTRVRLPSQAGDFARGQEDVFRVQLPTVGSLERLTVGLTSINEQACWLLEQVEVTDEATRETVFFPCSAWLGKGKGQAERCLLGSKADPREAQRQVARLRQQLDAAGVQLASAQAELAHAKAAAISQGAQQAQHNARHAERDEGGDAELAVRLAMQQAEAQQLQKQLGEAQQRAAATEAGVERLQRELKGAEAAVEGARREREAGREREGADAARAAALAAQLGAMQDELAAAQEGAAAAAAKARAFEAEAKLAEEELEAVRSQNERYRRDNSSRVDDAEAQVRRLRAEVAAKAAEVQEARSAEQEAADECGRLSRELAAERLRAKAQLEELQERLEEEADVSPPHSPTSAKLLAAYWVCIRTSSEPASAGTSAPVCLELVGSGGRTGAISLAEQAGSGCFGVGAASVFHLEAPAVGELQQLNIWVDVEGGSGDGGREAAWHLDYVEVACEGRQPTYFVCRKWLEAGCGYRAELAATSRNPRQEEVQYKVIVRTSSMAGCGTAGNAFIEIKGERASSGVLTLRNTGGSFRPGQADEFSFRLPSLGPLCELRVGQEGQREWHLDLVEVLDVAAGTSYYFPCEQWVAGGGPGGAMSRAVLLRGYTTDPRSLPVQYRVEAAVEDSSGVLGPDSLRLTLCGSRGESSAQRLDAGRATAGRTLRAMFEGSNVGQMERLRIGLAPGPAGQHCALRLSEVVVTNMPTGETATFHCPEWLRSADAYDFEVEAVDEQVEGPCRYRIEVQTSNVRRAGTAGNVYLTLVGDTCAIGPYQLTNTGCEHFQRGQLDAFEVEGAPDCGQLRQIEVRHDGAGRTNDWHLSWIKVANATTGAVAMFRCKRWVDRRRQEDPGAVGAVAASQPPPNATKARVKDKLQAKYPLLPLAGSAKAAAAVPLTQDMRMAAYRPSSSGMQPEWMDGGMGAAVQDRQAGAAGPAGAGSPAGMPGYRVVFHTSSMCGSGTNAKVHFELTGAQGSSGVVHPVGTAKSFGAGRVDIFEFPHMGPLGDLQNARVGTDASGFFPAWHLQLMVVTHLPTGAVWQFSCFGRIDKKVNYSRWLTLDATQKGNGYGGTSGGASGTSLAAWQLAGKPHALLSTSAGLSSPGPESIQARYPLEPCRNAAPSSPHYNPQQGRSGSPQSSPLRHKTQQQQQQHAQQHYNQHQHQQRQHQQQQMLAGQRPGTPQAKGVMLGRQQQWSGASASPFSPYTVARSGGDSSLASSPLIGTRR